MKHFLRLNHHSPDLLRELIEEGVRIKQKPQEYADRLAAKTLLMIFEKPSLRTRLSFEVGMTQMGGSAIFYSVKDSPLGRKESISDTSKVASRMVDLVMARLNRHADLADLAENSDVPVINGMCDIAHPCQILADFMTLRERWGGLPAGKKLTYVGDSCNNVTYSLMIGGAMMGFHVAVGCPDHADFKPEEWVCKEVDELLGQYGGALTITHDAEEAADGADVVYADSWMSYHVSPEEEAERIKMLQPYQVNSALMARASSDAVFMNCLPAKRGQEQTAEVIDGPQSIVFDQAENRLHAQKALVVHLAGTGS